MKPIIIVGTGMAGYTVAREFRKLDSTTPLLMMTADEGSAYSKPMLSNAFAQGKQAAQLVSQSAVQMSAQLNASIMTGTRVDAIDAHRKTVRTSAGAFEYSALVLAVGAQAIRLDLAGGAGHEVLSVNDIGDYARFRARIAQFGTRARVTILGAGLIGCEFADDLAGAGHHVTLVDPNMSPLAALAAPAISAGLGAALQARGVHLQLGTTAARVDREDDDLEIGLADGRTHRADIVLSAVGLRADLRLAQAAQLETGRGITVDQYGQTSAADVYALGDCAEYRLGNGQTCLPYIAPMMSAARAIARSLAGTPTAIDLKDAPVLVKTPSYPLALLPVPLNLRNSGEWSTARDGARLVCRFHDQSGVLRGFGIAPHDAATRQALLAEVGKTLPVAV